MKLHYPSSRKVFCQDILGSEARIGGWSNLILEKAFCLQLKSYKKLIFIEL